MGIFYAPAAPTGLGAVSGGPATTYNTQAVHTLTSTLITPVVGRVWYCYAHGYVTNNTGGAADVRLGVLLDGAAPITTASLNIASNAAPRRWVIEAVIGCTADGHWSVSTLGSYSGASTAGVQSYGVTNPLTGSTDHELAYADTHTLALTAQIATASVSVDRHGAWIIPMQWGRP